MAQHRQLAVGTLGLKRFTSTMTCRDMPRRRRAVGHRDTSMGETEEPHEKHLPWHVAPI